jgi:hypothetical protein
LGRGQLQSYRRHAWRWEGPLTFVHLNWKEASPESYGGTLTLTPYGPDRSFLAAILNECRAIVGFDRVDVPTTELPPEPEEPGLPKERLPAQRDDKGAHRPPPLHADAVEIGVSFAGDQPGPVKSWRDLPDASIEKWPLALAAALREMHFKVEEYRDEQSRAEHDKQPGRKAYLDRLASRDRRCLLELALPGIALVHGEFLRIHQRFEEDRTRPRASGEF